jgi:osmoprotectant transport system substrate-binding protein
MKKRIIILWVVVLLSFLVSACESNKDKVVVASKPFTESYILAEMLILLIEHHTDIVVDYRPGIAGGTANMHPAMLNGEIDIYPEYTGTGWLSVLGEEAIADPVEMYEAVKAAYLSEFNIAWLGLYGFNNGYGLAMKKTKADALEIVTYSDLAAKANTLVFGANADFYERNDGYPALKERYGFEFSNEVEFTAIGFTYQAIGNDEVDVINIFTTDGRLEEYGLVVLEDDLLLFPTYFASTVVRQEILEQYPGLEEVLNLLAGLIDDQTMSNLNYLVEIEKEDPLQVAQDFLTKKGLLD